MAVKQIPVFRPSMGEEEIQAVAEVLRSGWLGLGPKTKEFEDAFCAYLQYRGSCVAVNSCTAALDLAVRIAGIKPHDQVLVPALTFVSTAHAVAYSGAIPVFCDIDEDTLLVDINDMAGRFNKATVAAIVVHYGGRVFDPVAVYESFPDSGIKVIEDCAHACGSSILGQRAGTRGDLACFSFQAVKNLATGDGGMLVINGGDTDRAKKLRWLGIDKGTWDRHAGDRSYWWDYAVEEIGLKCHMNDINAAIGLVQLGKLEVMNARRKSITETYFSQLSDLPVRLPKKDTAHSQSSWHIFHLQTDNRDDLVEHLKKQGISTGVHYKPLHLYNCYGNKPHLPVAERVWKKLITLPVYPDMSESDVAYVVENIRSFYGK